MAHVYSLAAMLKQDEPTPAGLPFADCRALAEQAVRGLLGELRDTEHGGWFAGIAADGQILPGKQCYAHAFVILAASSAYLAGIPGAEALLREALAVYDRFFWDEEAGLAADTWDTGFMKLDDYRGLNANMHSVEAFLAVWDATGNPVYLKRAGRIIRRVTGWAEANGWRIPEHFTQDWQSDLDCNKDRPDDPFKPYGATPGHGIEWARLILQYAAAAQDEDDPTSLTEAAAKLYDRAISDAWACDGAPGLVYTTDWSGKPVVHDRMHWTLAEAINTSAVLYRVTGGLRYSEDYAKFLQYLDRNMLDHAHGSWYHQLDRKNQVIGTVWPGKSDLYHAVQATLIPYNPRVGVSIAAAVRARA